MAEKKKVLAISGSVRANSVNMGYIKAVSDLAADEFSVTIFEGLKSIPAFDPDEDIEVPAVEVRNFRQQLKNADGILICTPEYAMGVPGALKNAIDWTVSSMEFSKKPVALITASLSGLKAHAALLDTLRVIESRITDATATIIPFAKTKISVDGKITDEDTRQQLHKLVKAFSLILNEEQSNAADNN